MSTDAIRADTFAHFDLSPSSYAALAAMGISQPTPIQQRAIPPLLGGRDVIGQARTGSGKTLAFGLPMMERCDARVRAVQALVLVPTRELAIQVGEVLNRLAAPRGLRLTLLYGGRSDRPEHAALAGGAQIVVGAPGRTLDHLRQGSLRLQQVRLMVLDEADEMLDRGFAPDVERILARTPKERQTALFSATVPDWVRTTAAKHLRNPVTVRVDPETSSPPEIEHLIYDMEAADRLGALRSLLDERGEGPTLVFGRTKHGVKKLARQLEQLGYPVAALQGNLSQNARERAMAAFRSGSLPILVATNVAARGLDVEGIEQVINYELPDSPELFTHRVGRTGRMGRRGEAITFLTPDDGPKWREFERALGRRFRREVWGRQSSPVHGSDGARLPSPQRFDRLRAGPTAERGTERSPSPQPSPVRGRGGSPSAGALEQRRAGSSPAHGRGGAPSGPLQPSRRRRGGRNYGRASSKLAAPMPVAQA